MEVVNAIGHFWANLTKWSFQQEIKKKGKKENVSYIYLIICYSYFPKVYL